MAAPKPSAKKTAAKKTTAAGGHGKAKDLAAGYFAQQPADKRALLEKLRALVMKAVPDAKVSIKWGVPFYQREGTQLHHVTVEGLDEWIAWWYAHEASA